VEPVIPNRRNRGGRRATGAVELGEESPPIGKTPFRTERILIVLMILRVRCIAFT
jgi:hypothetical protein